MDLISEFEALLMEYATRGEHEHIQLMAAKLDNGCALASMTLIAKVVAHRKQDPCPLLDFDEYAYEYLAGVLLLAHCAKQSYKHATLVWLNRRIHLYFDVEPPSGGRQLRMTHEQARLRIAVQRRLHSGQLPCARISEGRAAALYSAAGRNTETLVHHPVTRLGIANIDAAVRATLPEAPFAEVKWVAGRVLFHWTDCRQKAEAKACCSGAIVSAAVSYEARLPQIEQYYYGHP